MNIDQALDYILSTTWKGSRLGLERVSELMDKLGNPQKDLKIVHIAGTNGKGSTSAMIASIAQKAGLKTGLFTSPHLRFYQERIMIDGHNIDDKDFCIVTEAVKKACDQMEEQPTVFEKMTAMALLYYKMVKADLVVLEVGLGGRLDSTNVIDAPEVAVITNLGLEHTEILGDTIEKIAAQKAGIIKNGGSCVCYDCPESAVEVIREKCLTENVDLTVADFNNIESLEHNLAGQRFNWKNLTDIYMPLLGVNQLHNVNVVLEVIDCLNHRGFNITRKAIYEGLAVVNWPARFQLLSSEPLFILDGGHNPQCVTSLRENIDKYLPDQKLVFLVGVLADKDYRQELETILPVSERFVCLTPDSERALANDKLAEVIQGYGKEAEYCQNVAEGIELALSYGLPVVAFGSLYMAGDILEYFPRCGKKVQRQIAKNKRNAISNRNEKDYLICEKLKDLPEIKNAKTIGVYKAIGSEVNLQQFIVWAKENNKNLVLPLSKDKGEMNMHVFTSEEGLVKGKYGILEPEKHSEVISKDDIDVMIIPALAYDRFNNRLGHGAGYYDRYLNDYKGVKLLVAYKEQYFDKVVTNDFDIPMDKIISE